MSSLIPLVVVDQEARVDSRLIAAQLGVDHQNARELIQQYQADFEEFGILRFETGEIKGRGQPEKFVLLNEDQSYLLLTYCQNTPQARDLKKRLVHTFGDYRRKLAALAQPQPAPVLDSEAALAAQLARLLAGKILVDREDLMRVVQTAQVFRDMFARLDPLVAKMEAQCGQPIGWPEAAPAPAPAPAKTPPGEPSPRKRLGKKKGPEKTPLPLPCWGPERAIVQYLRRWGLQGKTENELIVNCRAYNKLRDGDAVMQRLIADGFIVQIQPGTGPGIRRKLPCYVAKEFIESVVPS